MMKKTIEQKYLEKSILYSDYRINIEDLFKEGKVTGPVQSEALLEYTKVNFSRMRRHEKTTHVPDDLRQLIEAVKVPMIWLTITEGWCGDAAQTLPVIAKMADVNDNIKMRTLLRDEHPELMDLYLTNGARSIPIVIGLHADTREELFRWGPRPAPAMDILSKGKQDGQKSSEIAESIHRWYAKDRSETLFAEFRSILQGLVND